MAAVNSCNVAGCEISENLSLCSTCHSVYYCSKEHQRMDWKSNHSLYCHMPIPKSEVYEGYPNEVLINVFEQRKNENGFLVPDRDKLSKPTSLPIIFKEQLNRHPMKLGYKMVVDEPRFKEQFDAFTSSMFSNWSPDLWKNILCAGGAALASILPLEDNYERRNPPCGYAHEFDVSYSQTRRTMQQYMKDVRWPKSDIDLFCYGLKTPEIATKKLEEVLSALKARVKELHGDEIDVAFIRTVNSVTIDYGNSGRRIQFILRLFDSASSILNTFDIDCCCVGYDGKNVFMTGRAKFAIINRVNVVDLSLRGDAFESRLIKYAERGFALAIPGLDLKKIDKKYLNLPQVKSPWGNYLTFTTDGWGKWGDARNLEKLMLADFICKKYRRCEELFPSRKKNQPRCKDDIDGFNIITNNIKDSYPSRNKWRQLFPATMQMSALVNTSKNNIFRIEWHEGPMPRKPISFHDWSANVFDGSKKEELEESEVEARRIAQMKRVEEMRDLRLKNEKDKADAAAAENQPPPIIETGQITMSQKLQAALRWLDLFKNNLPYERCVNSDDAFSLQRSLHPQTPIVYISKSTEMSSTRTEDKVADKDILNKIKAPNKSELKPASLKQSNVQIKVRVWMVSRVYYELREKFPEILEQIYSIFADERNAFQHQKKVGDNVFEGRLNKKARFFFCELEPDKFIVTSVCLNHKGFTKIISNSAELGRLTKGLKMSDEEDEEEACPLEKERHDHALVIQKIMTDFHAERDKVSSGLPSGLRSSSWCLPRIHLGNLDMLFEMMSETSAQPLLTLRQTEVIQQSLKLGCMLIIKGSAGNGKTTIMCEICDKLAENALLVVPNEALKAQVLNHYPRIKAVTLRERIDALTPIGSKKVTFGEFVQAKKEQVEKKIAESKDKAKIIFDAHECWKDRSKDPFYAEWKAQTNRKDENDLWEYLVTLNQKKNLNELEQYELKRHFCLMLIDEAQSMTSLQLRILALSSGSPQLIIVGMDSKQTIGKDSAGRKSAVKTAILEAYHNSMINKSSKKQESFEHSTVALTTNFRCPVSALQTLDIVISSWLKKYFKSKFDDFNIDTAVQSKLWDAPPVFIFKSALDVATLLRYMPSTIPILLKQDGSVTPSEIADRVVSIELSNFRGMEFEDLIIMSSPLSNSSALFKDIIKNGPDSKSAEKVCDYLCLIIVMLTRARAGIIWIENNTQHPLLQDILNSENKCAKVCDIKNIKDVANILNKIRKDSVDDDETCTGMFSVIRMISKVINVITERIESYQSITNQCSIVSDLISRLRLLSITEQDQTSNGSASSELLEICDASMAALNRLPEAILRIQLLKAPDPIDIDNIKSIGDLMIDSFLDSVRDIDPEPSPSLAKLHSECSLLALKVGKK